MLVTRPAERAGALGALLEAAGAEVTTLPTIRLSEASAGPEALLRAARRLDRFDWVAVTSEHAVRRLHAAVQRAGSAGALARCGLAAIGPSTAEAARAAWGGISCLVPPSYRSEALAASLLKRIPPAERSGTRVLLVQAEGGRPVLRERLLAAGIQVEAAPAYRAEVNWSVRERLLEFIEAGRGDWLTYTASSAARAFVELAGPQTGGALVAAISPVTAATLTGLGLPVQLVAASHTARGLVDAMRQGRGAVPTVAPRPRRP